MWNLTKVRSKDEGRKCSLCLSDGHISIENAELEAKHQKYKGRVVLRGDFAKDDSGFHALLKEQGFSASQMTTTKVRSIISRLPGCDGHAADAVSAETKIKMEDAHKSFSIPKIGIFIHLDSSTTTQMALNHLPVLKTQLFLLNESIWSSFDRTLMGETI